MSAALIRDLVNPRPIVLGTGYRNTYLEKQSINTILYLLPCSSGGNGPIVSTATLSNGK